MTASPDPDAARTTALRGAARALKVMLIFSDDSSLVICRRLADQLTERGIRPDLVQFRPSRRGPPRLSERQIAAGLGRHPLQATCTGPEIVRAIRLGAYDMVASAKFPILLRRGWRWRLLRLRRDRPCFVGLFPGLEFWPEAGFRNRQQADILCFNTPADRARYEAMPLRGRPPGQVLLHFNPNLVDRRGAPPDAAGPVAFFAQSVSPATRAGRLHVLATLAEAARRHPNRSITVKLRHRRDENRAHTHLEEHSYEDLALELPGGLPANLSVSDAVMDEILPQMALAITCTSTAGMEALAHGIPTLFFLEHAEADRDALNAPMRAFLAGSGLAAGPEAVLALERRDCPPAWLDERLSDPASLDRLLAAVVAWRARRARPLRPLWRRRR